MNEEEKTPECNVKIKIQIDGAYVVIGGVQLTTKIPVTNEMGERIAWADGDTYPEKQKYSLCRCGLSKNKPYCDSTHKEIHFDGNLTADREPSSSRWKIYAGVGITMTDDESLCAAYTFCDRFGSVWNEIENTTDSNVKKRLQEQIHKCPSGRLQYFLEGQDFPSEIKYEPQIAVIPNGPLWVLGGIPVEAPDGFTYEVRNRQLLCRCGHSSNKPFCDGTHSNIDFKTG